jgi:uncharacterized SAM-binding protein YcdF (DUF218 family)
MSEGGDEVEAVVVLGKGYNPDKKQRASDSLSERSKWNVLAAGELYRRGITHKLIFAGGRTAKGMDSEAAAMRTFLQREYPDIPEDAVFTEEESIDTASNVERVRAKLSELQASKVGLLTTQDHLRNSERLFQNYEVPITRSYSSEDIVRGLSPIHSRNIDRYMKSWRQRFYVRPKEAVRGALLRVDKKGKAANWVVRKFSSRTKA